MRLHARFPLKSLPIHPTKFKITASQCRTTPVFSRRSFTPVVLNRERIAQASGKHFGPMSRRPEEGLRSTKESTINWDGNERRLAAVNIEGAECVKGTAKAAPSVRETFDVFEEARPLTTNSKHHPAAMEMEYGVSPLMEVARDALRRRYLTFFQLLSLCL